MYTHSKNSVVSAKFVPILLADMHTVIVLQDQHQHGNCSTQHSSNRERPCHCACRHYNREKKHRICII